MGDTNRTSQDREDTRSDLERVAQSRSDSADTAGGGDDITPLQPTGAEDGVSGTAGEVKNQDRTAQ